MLKKILIAEDHESANISVQRTLEELKIEQVDYVYYCDDAFKRIQISGKSNQPYDLLITDLYFEEDQIAQQLKDGISLITAVRQIQPAIKVLVFSAENKPATIENLYKQHEIDAYVRKARNDAKELKAALDCIRQNQRYLPRHVLQLINQKNSHEFSAYDITILTLLAEGRRQYKIPELLKEKQVNPTGLSSMEKRLKLMREVFGFSNNEQLIAYCKDMGII